MIEVTLHLQTREGSRAIPLTTDQLKIGRGEEVDLRLDDDGLALRQATIYREGERVWLVDETSVSRTQVNHRDVPAAGISLTDGDEVRLGHHSRLWVSIKRNAGSRTKIKHPVVPSQTVSSRPFLVAAVLTVVMVIGLGAYIHSNSDRVPIPETTSPSPTVTINITPSPTPTTVSTFIPPPPNLYRDKNDDAAKLIYVEEKAQAIARIMSSDQGTYRFTPEALKSIMRYVNGYAGRLRGTGGEMVVEDCQRGKFITAPRATWKDDLQTLYGRARCYAPLVNKAFYEKKVPEVVGLYIVMIETEFNNPVTDNQAGAMGMFQFLASTARGYKLQPEDRCDVLKMVKAAADYMNDQMFFFGTDQLSMSLAVAGYNRGNGSLIRDLKNVQKEKSAERSFWELMLNSEKFDKFFEENVKYVPKFFAAAIVGENPKDFGLTIEPLSTYKALIALPPQGLYCQRARQ